MPRWRPRSTPTPTSTEPQAQARLAIIDGDVHPALRSLSRPEALPAGALVGRSSQTYGSRRRHGMSFEPYPKSAPRACRRDAWPENGGPPGSDLDLIRAQYLDAYGIEYGILGPLGVIGPERAQSRACRPPSPPPSTTGSASTFTRPEPRLKARPSSCPYEDGAAAAQRDRALRDRSGLRAGVHADAHVGAGRQPPLLADLRGGRARTACRSALHVFGAGGHPYTGAGWPSYYIEEGAGHSTSCQTVGHQPRHRGRVRALPEPQGRHRRGRLRLAAAARRGGSTSCSSACAARCRT